MTTALVHSWHMTVRQLRHLLRQPWYVAISLVQPIIWLLLFGTLFKRVVQIPGFGGSSYITFLTPGVVMMTALFSSAWAGVGMVLDLDRGVMDRFLVSPVRRGALIAGRLAQQAIVTVIQSAIVIGLGVAVGARFAGGLAGAAVLVACAVLLSVVFGALSNALALLARKQEPLVVAIQFLGLPLVFLSSAFMQQRLASAWIQGVARLNPVNWAVQAGREALGADVGWGVVTTRVTSLLALAAVCAWLATRAFLAYQRAA
jgi:ABC-2 type transport system permease protein